ncbi:uncharacterized protein LOC115578113 [Sparus aurata]|uniref:uncharacterized protein LOC115578113 n=1 Tax=Sparus aurata TaxID=8175 RepID=UPI0011C0ED08|nr:uncharacterized protein LOC115578113 [Sparus aurata]
MHEALLREYKDSLKIKKKVQRNKTSNQTKVEEKDPDNDATQLKQDTQPQSCSSQLQSEHQQCSIFSESDKEQQPLSGHGPTKLDTEPTIQNDIDTLLEEAGPPPPLLSQEKSLSVEVSETLTLQSLWKRNDTEVVVAVIPSVNRAGCSFLIHHSELCSLRPHEWLTGEVMEGLFHVYAKRFNLGRSVLILNHYTAGVILFGTPDKVRQHSLRRTDFSNYGAVLSFVNVGGVHWKLLFVLPAMKAVFLLDPMANNSEQAESADAAKRIRDYMRFRMITLGKNDWGRLRWRGLTMDHPVQQDKCSCGVIVTKMAKAVMEAFPALPAMSFGTSMKEMASERTNFALALLSDSVLDLDHHCVMCCASKPPVSGPPVTRWIGAVTGTASVAVDGGAQKSHMCGAAATRLAVTAARIKGKVVGFGAEENNSPDQSDACSPATPDNPPSSAYGEVSELTFLPTSSPSLQDATLITDIRAFTSSLNLHPYHKILS